MNRLKFIFFILIVTLFVGCAYFNTFYNANLFYDEAEQLRAEHEGERLSNSILDKYKSVVEKSDIVISKYDESKYVDDAYFLKGKAHYHLNEYDEAEYSFNTLSSINPKDYQLLSDYWLSLIKWKKGKPQPALNDLDNLLSQSDDNTVLAQIHKSQADIYLELKQDSLALSALDKAAELTKNRIDKGNIYFELAELADKIENYERAIPNYEKVIKYSYSNERVMDSHLKIVKRYRDLGKYNKASEQIQSMLNDPEFKTIYADLNLELAKLYLSQGDNDQAVTKLDEIVIDFPKTEISAEAFYILGEDHLMRIRDFEKADYYFKQIQKEFINSEFKDEGQLRLKELVQYNESKDFLNSIISKKVKIDSNAIQSVIDTAKIVLELYNLGELEAFHFNQIDTSLIFFNKIVTDYPNSGLYVKTLYTLSVIKMDLGDSTKSISYREEIISKYPDSEYAEYLRENNNNKEYGKSSLHFLMEAEKLYLIDQKLALQEYKNIANATDSEAACRALLFIANEYENNLFSADSALKYYELVKDRFPDSEQARFAVSKIGIINSAINDN